jgi:hypothetical protein
MDALHEDIAERLQASLAVGISDQAMKAVKKAVDDILYQIEGDIEYRMRDDLAPNLVAYVCEMAKRTVEAILQGNEDQMRRYLGCERGHWTGRSDSPEYGRKRTDDEWHPVIHGKLFETGAMELRKQIAEAPAPAPAPATATALIGQQQSSGSLSNGQRPNSCGSRNFRRPERRSPFGDPMRTAKRPTAAAAILSRPALSIKSTDLLRSANVARFTRH